MWLIANFVGILIILAFALALLEEPLKMLGYLALYAIVIGFPLLFIFGAAQFFEWASPMFAWTRPLLAGTKVSGWQAWLLMLGLLALSGLMFVRWWGSLDK